ncbi:MULTISPECIES: M23 family metallopeptidase [Polaribacter]|uniref:M23 family metallopeptidase n=1 Tax=Polaribacter marinaquae TaxID=1642819 RepID=A0ABZ2TNZ1_9FLAO|nr:MULTISPECIES: M23 family metallopeptidase [unclassified Polaribacter]AQS94306.1 peptidase M23 [Polaribacter sp. BM10]SHM88427.1 Murein DD-endopeptidase MepM and murein hydrolase activator NlpD, contain LysM domain [Polaribacter sp. KT 15]
MAKKDKKKGKLKQKLTDKYRLVVLNENTFEERFSLKLSRLNVFVLGGIFSILLISLTTLLIAFTPIKEYIPGYSSSKLKSDALKLTFEADSLKQKLAILENYTKALKPVLTGEISSEEIDSIQIEARQTTIDESKLDATKEDSLYREKIDRETRFSILNNSNSSVKIVFFAPLKGNISQSFDANSKHFALDIIAKTGTPVKAAAEGTVIFSGWSAETGYVIILKHNKDFISVYKHNGNLLKQQGDFVKSGEVIASVGSTGELSTGPHLHFELWKGGYAINPTNFIDFK